MHDHYAALPEYVETQKALGKLLDKKERECEEITKNILIDFQKLDLKQNIIYLDNKAELLQKINDLMLFTEIDELKQKLDKVQEAAAAESFKDISTKFNEKYARIKEKAVQLSEEHTQKIEEIQKIVELQIMEGLKQKVKEFLKNENDKIEDYISDWIVSYNSYIKQTENVEFCIQINYMIMQFYAICGAIKPLTDSLQALESKLTELTSVQDTVKVLNEIQVDLKNAEKTYEQLEKSIQDYINILTKLGIFSDKKSFEKWQQQSANLQASDIVKQKLKSLILKLKEEKDVCFQTLCQDNILKPVLELLCALDFKNAAKALQEKKIFVNQYAQDLSLENTLNIQSITKRIGELELLFLTLEKSSSNLQNQNMKLSFLYERVETFNKNLQAFLNRSDKFNASIQILENVFKDYNNLLKDIEQSYIPFMDSLIKTIPFVQKDINPEGLTSIQKEKIAEIEKNKEAYTVWNSTFKKERKINLPIWPLSISLIYGFDELRIIKVQQKETVFKTEFEALQKKIADSFDCILDKIAVDVSTIEQDKLLVMGKSLGLLENSIENAEEFKEYKKTLGLDPCEGIKEEYESVWKSYASSIREAKSCLELYAEPFRMFKQIDTGFDQLKKDVRRYICGGIIPIPIKDDYPGLRECFNNNQLPQLQSIKVQSIKEKLQSIKEKCQKELEEWIAVCSDKELYALPKLTLESYQELYPSFREKAVQFDSAAEKLSKEDYRYIIEASHQIRHFLFAKIESLFQEINTRIRTFEEYLGSDQAKSITLKNVQEQYEELKAKWEKEKYTLYNGPTALIQFIEKDPLLKTLEGLKEDIDTPKNDVIYIKLLKFIEENELLQFLEKKDSIENITDEDVKNIREKLSQYYKSYSQNYTRIGDLEELLRESQKIEQQLSSIEALEAKHGYSLLENTAKIQEEVRHNISNKCKGFLAKQLSITNIEGMERGEQPKFIAFGTLFFKRYEAYTQYKRVFFIHSINNFNIQNWRGVFNRIKEADGEAEVYNREPNWNSLNDFLNAIKKIDENDQIPVALQFLKLDLKTVKDEFLKLGAYQDFINQDLQLKEYLLELGHVFIALLENKEYNIGNIIPILEIYLNRKSYSFKNKKAFWVALGIIALIFLILFVTLYFQLFTFFAWDPKIYLVLGMLNVLVLIISIAQFYTQCKAFQRFQGISQEIKGNSFFSSLKDNQKEIEAANVENIAVKKSGQGEIQEITYNKV